MQPFESLDELIEFLLSASGSLSLYWIEERITLFEDACGFHGYVSRCSALEMERQSLAA